MRWLLGTGLTITAAAAWARWAYLKELREEREAWLSRLPRY